MIANKTIVLTGSNGGIGSEIAKKLAEEGATLVLVGLDKDDLEQQLKSLTGSHHAIPADISMEQGRQAIFDYCDSLANGIDMLINNAGIGQFSLFSETSSELIAKIIGINLTSTMLLTQALLPLLQHRSEANIVNMGSIFGSIGFPASTVYCASKFGIKGFSEALSRELADTSVSVSYFAPRATKTAINSVQVEKMNDELGTKMDSPEQVASAFVDFLKKRQSRFYMGWPEKLFVRINSILPSIVDKSIIKQLPIIKRYL
ncbi:MAG: SDR family oxidoreductase [Methylophaga sp.]|nr:SDR family oxidoreductase [Methylophaga sp.]